MGWTLNTADGQNSMQSDHGVGLTMNGCLPLWSDHQAEDVYKGTTDKARYEHIGERTDVRDTDWKRGCVIQPAKSERKRTT